MADHLIQADPHLSDDDPMLEAISTLAFLAAHSETVRLGTMVASAVHRPPALLVKSITTIDVLSGGRAWLGLGAGYDTGEAAAMGLDAPSTRDRLDRLEETLQIATRMFLDDSSGHTGRHYTLARPVNRPLPASRPRIPILLGGSGENRTLPLVAAYADACNLFDVPDGGATVRRKLNVLRTACDRIGRDADGIDKTISTQYPPGSSADDAARTVERLGALGATHVVLMRSAPWTVADVAALGRLDATTAV